MTRPLLILATVVAWLAAGAAAGAASATTLELRVPGQARVGEVLRVEARLVDEAGLPVSRAPIVLWTQASFLGVSDSLELGRARTGAGGVATFELEVRAHGTLPLHAYFPGDAAHEASQTSAEVAVTGSRQLYQERAGVRVPGVGVWMIVLVLGGVWSAYLLVMLTLLRIARLGRQAPREMEPRYG